MEAGPFGPWRRQLGAQPVDDDTPVFEEAQTPGWRTGTRIDSYTPIYMSLAQHTKTHGPIGPAEARDMDLTVVAAMLGVGKDDWSDWAAEMRAGRAAAHARGEEWEWPD